MVRDFSSPRAAAAAGLRGYGGTPSLRHRSCLTRLRLPAAQSRQPGRCRQGCRRSVHAAPPSRDEADLALESRSTTCRFAGSLLVTWTDQHVVVTALTSWATQRLSVHTIREPWRRALPGRAAGAVPASCEQIWEPSEDRVLAMHACDVGPADALPYAVAIINRSRSVGLSQFSPYAAVA